MQQTGKQVPKVIAGALAVFAFGIVFSPDEAAAQIQPWEDSGYVSVNYAYEVADRSFSESLSATVYDETATYTANHSGGGGGGFDVGAGWRVWRNLAAGVTVTSFSTSSGAAVSGSVPHQPLKRGRSLPTCRSWMKRPATPPGPELRYL